MRRPGQGSSFSGRGSDRHRQEVDLIEREVDVREQEQDFREKNSNINLSSYSVGSSQQSSSNGSLGIIFGVIGLVLLIFIISCIFSGGNSSYYREKLKSGVGFNNNCIDDTLGWFNNTTKTSKRLKEFYDDTGVQPYIVMCSYNPQLYSDEIKSGYAQWYYDTYIDNECTFMYMYFSDYSVEDVGYMCCVCGDQASTVMDDEAIEIFWNNLDSNWYNDMSKDDLFVETFISTGDTIMTK